MADNSIDRRSSVVETHYWHTLDGARVQCDVCPRACKLKDGQRGLCFVRGAEKGRVRLFSYGRSSGFCIDPIEKKPLNHFLPGTSVLSFGTAGCNLACKFCQNWEILRAPGNRPAMPTIAIVEGCIPSPLSAASRVCDAVHGPIQGHAN